VDYGNVNPEDLKSRHYYTRQISLPVLMTVHKGIELRNMDIMLYLPLDDSNSHPKAIETHRPATAQPGTSSLPFSPVKNQTPEILSAPPSSASTPFNINLMQATSNAAKSAGSLKSGHDDIVMSPLKSSSLELISRDYCLFTADVANIWGTTFEVTFELSESKYICEFLYFPNLFRDIVPGSEGIEREAVPSIVRSAIVHPGSIQR
jgi:hypothetical protein